MRNGAATLLLIACVHTCAIAQTPSSTAGTPAKDPIIPIPLSELNHDAAVKETTETTLTKRTNALVIRAAQQKEDSLAYAKCMQDSKNAWDAAAIELDKREAAEKALDKSENKRKVGNAITGTIIAIETVAIAVLALLL